MKQCPYDCEVWATSTVLLYKSVPYEKITRVFAFDREDRISDTLDIARRRGIPIWSMRDYADCKYPIDEIVAKLRKKYFLNTISFMIALAIYEGYEKLKFFGIDQGPQWKYLAGKPYVMYWIGQADGRGIKTEHPPMTVLFQTHVEEIKKGVAESKQRGLKNLVESGGGLIKIKAPSIEELREG
jgi:hypothetical protein